MKTLLGITLIIVLPLSLLADDQPKNFRAMADSLESLFNNPGASSEQIKKAQAAAIEGLKQAAHSLEQKDELLVMQTRLTELAAKGHHLSDGKAAAVPSAAKADEYDSLTLKDGQVYRKVKVLTSDSRTLKFAHAGGIATVSLLDVPETMALKYIKP